MNFPRFTLCLPLLCLLACKPTLVQTTYTPGDCDYGLPHLVYSDPAECRPELTTFGMLSDPEPGLKMPPLPAACAPAGPVRMAYLDATAASSFILHVYKGAAGPVSLEVYGETTCKELTLLTECLSVTAVAESFVINTAADEPYGRYYVRIGLDGDHLDGYAETNFISLAAYAGRAPEGEGGIRYATASTGDGGENVPENGLGRLRFNCAGNAFQRLVLNACENDPAIMREWVEALGVTPSEEYYGEKGSVVTFDVPPGMDLNTTGGSAREIRTVPNGNGTAEPDYAINLFSPGDPDRYVAPADRNPLATEDPIVGEYTNNSPDDYFGNNLPPFEWPGNGSGAPLRVAIIDSGVETDGPNAGGYADYAYRNGPETEFIRNGNLGYDFIAKDMVPDDQAPHGSYVAASLLGEYHGARPLQLLHLRTFGADGIASYFGALVSFYEATAVGVDVINASWGIRLPAAPEALTCAVERAMADDVIVVTSAGNDSLSIDRDPQWPAAYGPDYPDRLVTVGSYWYKGQLPETDQQHVARRDFSNYSRMGRVTAAAYHTAPVPQFGAEAIVYPQGTSFSAPRLAGRLATFLSERPGASARDFGGRAYERADGLMNFTLERQYLPLYSEGGLR